METEFSLKVPSLAAPMAYPSGFYFDGFIIHHNGLGQTSCFSCVHSESLLKVEHRYT